MRDEVERKKKAHIDSFPVVDMESQGVDPTPPAPTIEALGRLVLTSSTSCPLFIGQFIGWVVLIIRLM